MAAYGSDYDRMHRNRGLFGTGGRGSGEFRGGRGGFGGYGAEYGAQSNVRGYDRYDRNLSGRGVRGYDANHKSDWQTNYGDPFGDRERGTPIRAMNGSFEDQFRNRNRSSGYDRGFGANSGRQRYDRGWIGADTQRYDRGWIGADTQRYDRGLFGADSQRYDRGLFGSRPARQQYDGGFFSRPGRGRNDSSWW